MSLSVTKLRDPRVSVVIPCYRDAATLGRALMSLQAQTRLPEEIIVVDDFSPEEARIRAVVGGIPRVIYLRNTSNLGLAGTRNRGLQEASGEIVAFLDADDEAHPQRIEWQLKLVAPDTAVACDVVRIPEGGSAALQQFSWPPRIKTYREVGTMIYANRLTGASLMAPAAMLRAVGGYDSSLRSCEDYDLWLRLLGRGYRVQRIRHPLYIYHYNAAGLSRRYLDIAHWELVVLGKFLAGGSAAAPSGFRSGIVWAVWLLRHFARATVLSDNGLRAQAMRDLSRLDRWPVMRWMVRAVAVSGVLKLWRFAFRARG